MLDAFHAYHAVQLNKKVLLLEKDSTLFRPRSEISDRLFLQECEANGLITEDARMGFKTA